MWGDLRLCYEQFPCESALVSCVNTDFICVQTGFIIINFAFPILSPALLIAYAEYPDTGLENIES